MTRKELVEIVHNKTGYTMRDIASVLSALDDAIEEIVASGDSVKVGCYKMYGKEKEATKAHNPKTGEAVDVPARMTARATVSTTFTRKMKEAAKK